MIIEGVFNMSFPWNTYEKMLKIVKNELVYDNPFRRKFESIHDLRNIDKMNRWFGYYQKMGKDGEIVMSNEIIKLKCYYCGKDIKIPDEYYDETNKYCCGKCLEIHKNDKDMDWREIDE